MKKVLNIITLTAIIFILYGILFALMPIESSDFVTDSIPQSDSGMIDMRATYGGMSIAVGLILLLLGKKKSTRPLALLSIIVVMLSMATTRLFGMLLDGTPNSVMWAFLMGELFAVALAYNSYRKIIVHAPNLAKVQKRTF